MTSYPPRRVDEGEQLHASQVVQACLLRRGVGPPNRARRDAAGLVLEAIASLGQEMERDQEPMMDDTHAESDTAEAGAVGPAALTGAGTGAAGLGAAAAAGAVAGIPGGALRALLGGTLGAAIGAAGGGALGVLTDRATARPDSSKAAAPVDHDPEPPSPTTDDRGVDR